MVNYNNGKIYKIESHLGDLVYIGSTTKQYLSQRMDKHRTDYKQWKDNRRHLTTSFKVFEEYGVENCSIVLVEAYPCESKDELHSREAHYITTIDCVNKFIPCRTDKQYRIDNKDKISKRYYDNKEIYSDKSKNIMKEIKKRFFCEVSSIMKIIKIKYEKKRPRKNMNVNVGRRFLDVLKSGTIEQHSTSIL